MKGCLSKGRYIIIASLLILSLLSGCAGPAPTPTPTAGELSIQWLGHSTFLLTSSQGTRLLIDPVSLAMGYKLSPISGIDAVLITHEHPDHNNAALATGSPLVLRGLSATGWNEIDQSIKDVSVLGLPTFHDGQQGAQRGRNTVFVLQVDGLRVVHLGDLGHLLTPEQVQSIGPVDVLMIPVGGFYTVDAQQATQVVQQLSPKTVLPMHYKTPVLSPDWPGAGVDDFLVGKMVQRPDSTTLRISRATLPTETAVVVLNYE